MRLEGSRRLAAGQGRGQIEAVRIGINFIDIYHRTGFYPRPHCPRLGSEGAGEVVEVGPSVGLKLRDRVAGAGLPGLRAGAHIAKVRFLFKLPKAISYETAAAMMLAFYGAHLVRQTYRVKEGDMLWSMRPAAWA